MGFKWEELETPSLVEGYGTQVGFAISDKSGRIVAYVVNKDDARRIVDALNGIHPEAPDEE